MNQGPLSERHRGDGPLGDADDYTWVTKSEALTIPTLTSNGRDS